MSEVTAPVAIEMTPAQIEAAIEAALERRLAASLDSPEFMARALQRMKDTAAAEKSAREAETKARAVKFKEFVPTLQPALDAIVAQYDVQTWFKRDPKTKEKTTTVSGRGFHVDGTTTLTYPDGSVVEARVTVWIKANPKNSAPGSVISPPEED